MLLATWVLTELRAAQPLVDMTMMRIPAVWTTNLVALLFGVGMYVDLRLPARVPADPGAAPATASAPRITASGFFLLPMTVTMFASGLLVGPGGRALGLQDRAHRRVGAVRRAVRACSPSLTTSAGRSTWRRRCSASASGFAFAAMSNIIVESVPMAQTGVASGMNANIRTIGGSIGAAVMASIVTSGAGAGGLPHESGYTDGFAFLLITSVLATLAAVAIPSARRIAARARAEQAALGGDQPTGRPAGEAPVVVKNAEAALVPGAPLAEVE